MKPYKFHPTTIIHALQATHGMVQQAAQYLGCDRECVYDYSRRFPAVAAELKRQRELTLDLAELKLYEAIDQGDPWAIMFYLRYQARDRGYVVRSEVMGHTATVAVRG